MKSLLLFFVGILCFWTVQSQTLGYSAYRRPAQMEAAMDLLTIGYPSLARVVTIGTTYEGRPIRALKIGPAAGLDDPRRGDVVFAGLHHAREWLSAEACLYTADRLLHRYATDAALRQDMNNLRIWIIPVCNPDGYYYTWSEGGNALPLSGANPRYWRKNRQPNSDGSIGTDLNRNYSHQWGALNDPSNEHIPSGFSYIGSAPFSARETQALRVFMAGLPNLKCLISHHSYSELYIKPWAYTRSDAPGHQTLSSVQFRNIDQIAAVHGHTYEPLLGYLMAGDCADYVWNQHRAAAFTPELRPSNRVTTNLDGFSPPASEILPASEENFAANRALIHDAALSGLWIKDNVADGGEEPFTAGVPWVSPDIWTVPATLNQGEVVQLHVRINNNTGVTQDNALVEVYFTDPRIMLEFPNPSATRIGSRLVSVAPGGTTEVFNWTVPNGTNSWGELHWCVGAIVKQVNDMPLTTIIHRSSNVACRNFTTEPVGMAGKAFTFVAENILGNPAEIVLNIDEQQLPAGVRIEVEKGWMQNDSLSAGSQRKARLLDVKGAVLEPGQRRYIRVKIIGRPTDPAITETDITVGGNLLPLVAGKREAVGNGFTYRVKWE